MMSIFNYSIDESNVIETIGKYMLADGYDFVIDNLKSTSTVLVDKRNGKELIDFFTCFASMPLGFNHPKMLDDDFINYIGRASLNKPSNSDLYSQELATFVETLFKIAVPDYFKYSFFISGGALAVENALKTAFDWKVRKNFAKGYKSEHGLKVIHFKEAFHGRTGYTLSLTNTDPDKVKYFPRFDWPRVSNPKIKFPLNDENLQDLKAAEQQSVAEIMDAIAANKDDIAAIIIEPIQGEGGDNHFSNDYMRSLRRIADENEIMLIFDEVQTGVGVTGTMWAHEQLGVKPDILCFGKKMQVCGILVTDRVDEVEENVFHTSSRINSTWGGNLTDMVRATKYLEIIHEENLLKNAELTGDKLLDEIIDLQEKYSGVVTNARGRGLFCAFDLTTPELRNDVIKKSFAKGLFALPCGSRSIRFRPPLNVDTATIKRGMEIIDKSIAELV